MLKSPEVGCYRLVVRIVNEFGTPLTGCWIKIRETGSTTFRKPSYDAIQKSYVFEQCDPGWWEIKVGGKGYESQNRNVLIESSDLRMEFRLGKPGCEYTYIDGGKYPVNVDRSTLGIVFSGNDIEEISRKIDTLGLTVAQHYSHFGILRSPKPLGDMNAELAALRRLPNVIHAGPILDYPGSRAILSQNIDITFRNGVPEDSIQLLFDLNHLEVKGQIGDAFILAVPFEMGLGVNTLLEKLNADRRIKFANPNLVSLTQE